MKIILIFIFLLFNFINFSFGIFESAELLKPKGFRIKFTDSRINAPVSYLVFNVNINKPIDGTTSFIATINEKTNHKWIYDNVNVKVKAGDEIHYRVDVFSIPEMNISKLEFQGVVELSEYAIDISPLIEETCSKHCIVSKKCESSITTVKGQSVCKGELIFEEHFDKLDPKIWKIDSRIPLNTEDSPFVSFQNDPEVVFTKNGMLNIKPKYLWTSSGFNESMIVTGSLNIENCTGTILECSKNARFSQILPPIISGRIQTKHSFSFRYGKIVIGAYMPRGDWLMPLLLLEPLEKYYGSLNYASGEIRIASIRGNPLLWSKEGKDISLKYLSGGVILDNRGPLHNIHLRHYDLSKDTSREYHNFTLTWTDKSISVGVDDIQYGQIEGGFSSILLHKNSNNWDSDNIMSPFDREFYLTIGLSVGGHTDFPDLCKNGIDLTTKPWTNNDPKAMLNFWRDRQNWVRSWERLNTHFKVDNVFVYAL